MYSVSAFARKVHNCKEYEVNECSILFQLQGLV
jgi:hypothetical protein